MIYAAVVMIWNASHHHAVIDPQVIVAAVGAVAFLYARFKVTPVADPKDGNGQPLVASATVAMLASGTAAGDMPAGPPEKTLITPAPPGSDQATAAPPPSGSSP